MTAGEIKDGVITCPWHNWTFNVCTGCSLDPPGNDVRSYETLIEGGAIYIKVAETPVVNVAAGATPSSNGQPGKPKTAALPVLDVVQETPDVRTFRLDNRAARLPFAWPGQFCKVCVTVEGEEHWRSFTISSPPTRPETIDLTVTCGLQGK